MKEVLFQLPPSKMTLSRICEEPKKIKRVSKTTNACKDRIVKVNFTNTDSTSSTHEKYSTPSYTENTLSMISTPWSTETWLTSSSRKDSSSYTTLSTDASFTSVEPQTRTTSTSGVLSPAVKTGSTITLSLYADVQTAPPSKHVSLFPRTEGSTPTLPSWTLETYTSTGLSSSVDSRHENLRVNYPWSPATATYTSRNNFDHYPSSLTLASQKGSRETCKKTYEVFSPMNLNVSTKDFPTALDWTMVKQNGIVRK